MATYSVYKHEEEPVGEPDAPAARPTVLRYRGWAGANADTALDPQTSGPLPQSDVVPPVVLQLPDLMLVDDDAGGWWTSISQRLFWVGIVLGAVVALILIWKPRDKAAPPLEPAPGWTSTPAASPEPTSYRLTPAEPAAIAPSPPFSSSAHEHAAHDHAASAARTARSNAPVWDGAAPQPAAGQSVSPWGESPPPVRPGEAAPTGKIINTW